MVLSRSGQEFTFDPDCRLGRHSALAGQHNARDALAYGLGKRRISWILDEDIRPPWGRVAGGTGGIRTDGHRGRGEISS